MANKSLATAPADQTILVTGGAGFIGSHTCVELLDQGYNVVVVDRSFQLERKGYPSHWRDHG